LEHPDPGFSLYVHVPLCTDKCLYCDFYSVPCRSVSEEVQSRLIDATIRQVKAFAAAAPDSAKVETLFVGGGTPSALPRRLQERLLTALSVFGAGEWTVEAIPETLDETFLSLCRAVGVNRLSVGIQTLQQDQLDLLKRRASREDSLRAISLLRKKWTGRLGLDFIAGIPGQTVEDVISDLSVVEEGWPSHVSLYQLTMEPGTPLAALVGSGAMSMNAPQRDEELWFEGHDSLIRRGYAQYEVSNFGRPGHECRHNIRYWNIDQYAGAGPAAVSTMPRAWAARLFPAAVLRESTCPVVRVSNPKNIEEFLRREREGWGAQIESISAGDFLIENLMMGLRLARGVSALQIQRRFGASVTTLFPGLWERWMEKGWADPPGERVRLTEQGLLLLDHLIGEAIEARSVASEGRDLPVFWP
jgi:oxygen-independent coproporphyrinogen III oxidase